MRLSYPLEIANSTILKGRARKIGTARVLFPAYIPVTKSKVARHFAHLNERDKYLDTIVVRFSNSNIIALASVCRQFAYNHYLFPAGTNDNQVLEYLTKYKGLKPEILKAIQHSHGYINFRKDVAPALYQWEHEIVPHVHIPFDHAEEIVEKEFKERGLNYQWNVSVCDSKVKLGFCSVYRRSGWLSVPYRIELGFRAHPYLHVVLHEIAHALDVHTYRANNHGPTFLLLYRDLLLKYMQTDFLPSMMSYFLFQGQKNGKVKEPYHSTKVAS